MYADGIDVVFFEEFSDAGAHIRNMAFYNLPLRMLKLVQESIEEGSPIMTMEQAVHRLTGDRPTGLVSTQANPGRGQGRCGGVRPVRV